MNNQELRNIAGAVEQAMLMAYKYNRLIEMLADLSPETLQAVFADAVKAGHTLALAELPNEIISKAK